jgi:hypothetical protein
MGREIARLEVDANVTCLSVARGSNMLVAGDAIGRIHRIDVVLLDEAASTEGTRSHVFLSYAREDDALCEVLASTLKARGIPVWYHREIEGGEPTPSYARRWGSTSRG